MAELAGALPALAAMCAVMVLLWGVSVYLRNVSIIDLFWGPVIALAAVVYWLNSDTPGARSTLVLVAICIWAARLGGYLYSRNAGKPEDRRYRAMRERNDPGFWFKSLYLVFLLQAVLAWIVSFAVYGAMGGQAGLGWLDYVGLTLFAYGLIWESVADWQLAQFLASDKAGKAVMNTGLWRYSRHPNYFGEFCLWWGIWLLAASAGAWWTIISPVLLSIFLLKVSGVGMLEADIGERRPGYAEYVRTTSTFVPMPPKKSEA